MHKIRVFAGRGLLFLVVFVVGVFVHELGHVFCAEALGGHFESLGIAPGVTIYPEIELIDWWEGALAWITYCGAEDWQNWHDGLLSLAGSTTTWVLSALALAALYVFRPRGTLHWILIAFSLLFVDVLKYTLFPMIGPRYYVQNPGKVHTVTCDEPEYLFSAWFILPPIRQRNWLTN